MKLAFCDSRIAVYDSVLPEREFRELWHCVQVEDYKVPTRHDNWIKVWRLNDSLSLSSREYLYSMAPFRNPFDAVLKAVLEIARAHGELVGIEGKAWADITLRSYLYPRGTKLSWHDDTGGYSGAFSYYVHPNWASTWGGELLVAETPALDDGKREAVCGPYIDHSWEDAYLLDRGMGLYISPKPNRLVLTAGGVYHSINRVDADAGDHIRCSVSGFFKTPEESTQPAR